MVDIAQLSEEPISMAEIKEIIGRTKKERKQLNFRETKTAEYINTFCKINMKEANEMKNAFAALNITRLKERHIIKIMDILPIDIETLKIIFTGEDTTIKTEDLNKIIEITKKYA